MHVGNYVRPRSPGSLGGSQLTCKFNQGGGKNSTWHREQVTNVFQGKSEK